MEMQPLTVPEASVLAEIDEQKPRQPVGLLSQDERNRLVERGFLGLYRWYTARSQETRNWNADLSFDWRSMRKDHSDETLSIIEGFFAVEQYVPDYVSGILSIIRRSHGRSHFTIRWGSEEEKHADMWRNAVLFGGRRSPDWVDQYQYDLRGQEWKLPWEDPMHMLIYTVFQERATQVNYLNLGLAAKGKHNHPAFANAADPVLAKAAQTIAVDEAAHYNFFLEGARLFLYYFPDKAIEAVVNVVRHFAMPAGGLIPDYDKFAELLHRVAVYGPREHLRDVVKVAMEQLGGESVKAVEAGIRKTREVPDEFGQIRGSSLLDTLDYDFIEKKIKLLFGRIGEYEESAGLNEVDPTIFYSNPLIDQHLRGARA